MVSTFFMKRGGKIRIRTAHPGQAIVIERLGVTGVLMDEIFIPVELAGVVAQAIEAAGLAVQNGPCAQAAA